MSKLTDNTIAYINEYKKMCSLIGQPKSVDYLLFSEKNKQLDDKPVKLTDNTIAYINEYKKMCSLIGQPPAITDK